MRFWSIIGSVFLGAFLVLITLKYWPTFQEPIASSSQIDASESLLQERDLQLATELIDISKPEEAIKIIVQYQDSIDPETPTGIRWLEQLVRASESRSDAKQLTHVYEYHPSIFNSYEKASLLVADTLITEGRHDEYQVLRSQWNQREQFPDAWTLIDADALLLEGKTAEAIRLLSSRSFKSEMDSERLIRLSLLVSSENPQLSLEYLDHALNQDPHNSDICSFRARILENRNQTSLALGEYLAALQANPEKLCLRDQLAEFYLRQNQYEKAFTIWQEGLQQPGSDFMWIKAAFWNKMLTNKPLAAEFSLPKSKYTPFIRYLLNLKTDEFWDDKTFTTLPNRTQILETQQAAFWLQLLNALKNEHEEQALELLQTNPFTSSSWNRPLELALQRILTYRKFNRFYMDNNFSFSPVNIDSPSLFFSQLEGLAQEDSKEKQIAMPEDLQSLLASKEAFAATFLEAGWPEAAWQLHYLTIIPDSFPAWVATGMTQVIRTTQGDAAALEFATQQKANPSLSLLIGELLLATGKTDEGLKLLISLAQDRSDIGQRAAWLVSLYYMDKKQFKEAKEIIQTHPLLAKNILGQETLARIALLEGNLEQAHALYNLLESKSSEAKSFLVRKAFMEKDWVKAQKLTEDLIRLHPDNTQLRDNLKRILEKELQNQNDKKL